MLIYTLIAIKSARAKRFSFEALVLLGPLGIGILPSKHFDFTASRDFSLCFMPMISYLFIGVYTKSSALAYFLASCYKRYLVFRKYPLDLKGNIEPRFLKPTYFSAVIFWELMANIFFILLALKLTN